MVDGRLNENFVAGLGEVVDHQADAFLHARHEVKLLAAQTQAVTALHPSHDRVPELGGGGGVAEDGVVEAAAQGFGDFGAHGKAHVGNPQGREVGAAELHFHLFV